MGVPSTRTPVRIARGTYANLTTVNALAALQEGEICFATDQDRLYVKEGSGLTSISASSTSSPTPSDISASPTKEVADTDPEAVRLLQEISPAVISTPVARLVAFLISLLNVDPRTVAKKISIR